MNDTERGLYNRYIVEGASADSEFFVLDLDHDSFAARTRAEHLRLLSKNGKTYEPFRVERTDGSSDPGGKHERCRYHVLNLNDDPCAVSAIKFYAVLCASDFSLLSNDLLATHARLAEFRAAHELEPPEEPIVTTRKQMLRSESTLTPLARYLLGSHTNDVPHTTDEVVKQLQNAPFSIMYDARGMALRWHRYRERFEASEDLSTWAPMAPMLLDAPFRYTKPVP